MDPDPAPTGPTDERGMARSSGRRSLRQHGLTAGALLVALVAVVTAGPAVASRVGDALQHDSYAAAEPAQPAARDDATTATTAVPTSPAAPAASTPSTAASPSSVTPTTPAPVPVTRIQTVPAVRDLIIDVGGRRLATDADGSITLDAGDADATVSVVGTIADPPIQTVGFATWGDGDRRAERAVSSLTGPVATIGLVVERRVLATAADGAADRTVTFGSDLGDVQLDLGQPTWVPATVAAPSGTGLVAAEVTYSLPSGQTFRPTPEATWRITP